MEQAVLNGDPPIAMALRRSGRARRISLRISRIDGRVTLSLPPGTDAAEGLRFARSRESWLRGVLAECRPERRIRAGETMRVDGRLLTLVVGSGKSACIAADRLELPATAAGVAARAMLKHLAGVRARAAVERHAATLGVRFGRLSLRDTRSRWGSCSGRGDLMLSWRLILAPPGVLDYVAAHEVAHLVRMDHSPAFWAVVGRLRPDHAVARRWLRRHGAELHQWRFD